MSRVEENALLCVLDEYIGNTLHYCLAYSHGVS